MSEVLRRDLTVTDFEGAKCLAITSGDDGQLAHVLSGADATRLVKAATSAGGTLRQVGNGFAMRLPKGLPATRAEASLFEGRRTFLALRPAASDQVAIDWVRVHARLGVTGFVIFVDDGGDAADRLAAVLARADLPEVRILCVAASVRLFKARALAEEVLIEAMFHRYLAEAETVTCLDVTDVLMGGDKDVFDRAKAAGTGRYVPLRGWVTHAADGGELLADGVMVDRVERRMADRWCIAPDLRSEHTVLRETWIQGAARRMPSAGFVRVMSTGWRASDVPKPTALVEDPAISAAFARQFDVPGRRPVGVRLTAERGPVIIVTTMKNEGPYIVDWLAHHRVVGIENTLVYSNDCEDGTDALLDLLADYNIVKHKENPYQNTNQAPQRAAFHAALSEPLVAGASWILPLDVDEYLTIHADGGGIADLFDAVPRATVFSLPWRLFGNADVVGFEDVPVTEQFRLAAPDYAPRPVQAWGFKSLFRNDGTFHQIGVHKPRRVDPERKGDVVWVNGSGHVFPEADWEDAWRDTPSSWGYGLAQINHYAVRSADAFLVKRARGRTNHVKEIQGLEYWFRMNFNGPEERSIDRYAPAVAVERARLMALPGVAEAHARSVAWHRAKIAALKKEPEYSALWKAITGDRMKALSRRLAHFGNAVFFLGPDVIPEEVVSRKVGGDWEFTVRVPKER